MSKYRFKTEEEFKTQGLWDNSLGCPKNWNSGKAMNRFLGKDVPEEENKQCDIGATILIDYWTFQGCDYVLKERKVIPENWCVKITAENKDKLKEWRSKQATSFPAFDFEGYLTNDQREGSYLHYGSPEHDGYKIISFEDFLEHVYNKTVSKTTDSDSTVESYVNNIKDKITIGEFDCYVDNMPTANGGGYFLENKSGPNRKIVTQFGISVAEIEKILLYPWQGEFPICKDFKDLNKIIGFLKSKESTKKELKKEETVLSVFPTEGFYRLSNPKSDNLIKKLRKIHPTVTDQKNPSCIGVSWNVNSFWFIVSSSSKPEYTYKQLSKFIDDDIVEEKEEINLIVGKWYNLKDSKYFGKFLRFKNNLFVGSEVKVSNYSFGEYKFCEYDNKRWTEATQEQLDSFLPEGHPDKSSSKKLPVFIVGKWYAYNGWYIKFLDYDGEIFHSSESIDDRKKYSKRRNNFGGSDQDYKRHLVTDLSIISDYLPDGHPDKIVKKQYIKGKWYTGFDNNDKIAAKCDWASDDYFYFTELIRIKEGHKYHAGNWSLDPNIVEADISIIQHHLPPGHSDLILPEYKPGDYVYLLQDYNSLKKGEIYLFLNYQNSTKTCLTLDHTNNRNNPGKFLSPYVKECRKATTDEILSIPKDGYPIYPRYVKNIEHYGFAEIGKIYDTSDEKLAKELFALTWHEVLVLYKKKDKKFVAATEEEYIQQETPSKKEIMKEEYSPFLGKFVKLRSGEKYKIITSSKENSKRFLVLNDFGWTLESLSEISDAYSVPPEFLGKKCWWYYEIECTIVDEVEQNINFPFKEGDIIVGLSDDHYYVTNKDWVGKVTSIYPGKSGDLTVSELDDSSVFIVNSKYFRLATSEEISQRQSLESMAVKTKSTESIINVVKGDLPQTIKVKNRPII